VAVQYDDSLEQGTDAVNQLINSGHFSSRLIN